MTWKLFERNYWRYYRTLEKEFIEIIEYIDFSTDNYAVYSMKLMQLLLSIGAEIDSVMKAICGFSGNHRYTMSDYAPVILSLFPTICPQKVYVRQNNLSFIPFENWDLSKAAQSLAFWTNYNEVKHHRLEKYCKASLESVASALAALFILNMYELNKLYLDDANVFHNMPEDESALFFLDSWTQRMRSSKVAYHYEVIDDDDGNSKSECRQQKCFSNFPE